MFHSAVIIAAALLANYLPLNAPLGFIDPTMPDFHPWLEKMARWDAQWYAYLAEHGYTAYAIVFFPALILLIQAVAATGLDYLASGMLVANLFALLSFYLLYLVCRLDYNRRETNLALFAYAAMPTSLFLNSIYTEPLFLTFALAAVYFSRQGRWWYAGLFAACATLTRNIGIVLMLFMAVEMWLQRDKLRSLPLLPLGLPPLGLMAYMAYNYRLTGDFIAFVHTQAQWGRSFGFPWTNIWTNLQMIYQRFPNIEPGIVLDIVMLLFALGALCALTFSSRFKIRSSYLLLGWIWLLIPLFSTSSFFPLYSIARFTLIVFPLYLFVAQLPRRYSYGYLLLGTSLLLISTALFINWYWIG